jgi:hypothetical protein
MWFRLRLGACDAQSCKVASMATALLALAPCDHSVCGWRAATPLSSGAEALLSDTEAERVANARIEATLCLL